MIGLDKRMHATAKIEVPATPKKKRQSKGLTATVDVSRAYGAQVIKEKITIKRVKKSFTTGDRDPSIFVVVHSNLWEQTGIVRKGLPSSAVDEMSDALAMPRASFLNYLQLPRSTIEARIKKNIPLTPTEGDAVLRSAKALARAQEVFEDRKAASSWLKREIRSLGGVTPVSLMDTDSGFELVMHTLGRIEHGVVA